MKKFIVVLGMLFQIVYVSHAQQSPAGTINLKVTDKTGKPLPFASVLLRHVKDSVLVKGELTTEDGNAKFEKIPDGNYFVQASQLGYNTHYSASFNIGAGHKNISLNTVQLESLAKNLQAVNVTAQKPFIEREAGKTVLNVESSPTAAGNTALDILRRAPGVQLDQNEQLLLKGKSVQVMIDGKLTYLTGDQLTDMLKSTAAETIAQIEIMTTPPAKYDAAGNGGIINIKTKKGKLTGINGSVNATLSQAYYGFYSAGGNFNWRTTKFNLYGDFNRGDRPFRVTREYSRNVKDSIMTTALRQSVAHRNEFINNTYKAGLDYFLDDKNTVGVLVNGYANSFGNRIISQTRLGQVNQQPDSVLHSLSRNDNHFDNVAVNVNYKSVLDTAGGRELSVDLDYARFNNHRHLTLNDSLYDMHSQKFRNFNGIQNFGTTQITIKSAKADLSWPLGKQSKIEAGVKASFVTTSNIFQYDSLLNGHYITSPGLSDQFRYQEDIYAAYASYKKAWKKFSMQLGLRAEQTNSEGTSYSVKSSVKRTYLDFFPNINLEEKINDKHKLNLAYTRRIERPEYSQLNPFLFYLDRYTFGHGNPYLRPQYSDNTELSYIFKDKYILTLGYNRTKDFIEEFIEQNDSTKASISVAMNYNWSKAYTVSLTIPADFTKWWHMDNNMNTGYSQFHFQGINGGAAVTRSSFTYYINSTNTFTLPKDYKIELTAFYESPFVYALFDGVARHNMNIGIQKTFLDKKATIKLTANNLLQNQFYRGNAKYANLDMSIYNTWQFKTYSIYFSYKFGSSSIKAARDRQTGTSAEQKRAG
ncbi:outer membrane beta-barrel protein [Chitinophaga vietnamensis]|uniref:outer membrane beta-barrel protein n=1 Tax=Chitinophaga vietnamensis TaxID=2593957 RepID=UPI001178626A|nr:outer membrane beta-barrel protein [Chitinophaga vietnamensis]